MNETELSEYCRSRGLYREQLSAWRTACERANDWDRSAAHQIARETKDDRKRIHELERELARKEKALAEAAALMILRKKAYAICGVKRGPAHAGSIRPLDGSTR
jgi:transposase-like protein